MPEDQLQIVESFRSRPWRTAVIVAATTVSFASAAAVRRHFLRQDSIESWAIRSSAIARLTGTRASNWLRPREADVKLLALSAGQSPELFGIPTPVHPVPSADTVVSRLTASMAMLNQLHSFNGIWLLDRQGKVIGTISSQPPPEAARKAAMASLATDSARVSGPFPVGPHTLAVAFVQRVIADPKPGPGPLTGRLIGSVILTSDATPLLTEAAAWSDRTATEAASLIVQADDSIYEFALAPDRTRGAILGAWQRRLAPPFARAATVAVAANRDTITEASVASGSRVDIAAHIDGLPWGLRRREIPSVVFASVDSRLATEFSTVAAIIFMIAIIAIARRQTSRERRHRETAESEVRYRLLADNATDIIVRHAPDGRIVYISPAVYSTLGYRPRQLEGRHLSELSNDDDSATMDQILDQLRVTDGGYRAEHRLRHADGRYIWLETTGRAIRDPVWGNVIELVTASRDVDARKEAESALRASNEFIRALFDSSPVAIIATDLSLEVVQWNGAAERLFGWSAEEVIGKPYPLASEAMQPEIARSRARALREGRFTDVQVQRVRRDGSLVDLSLSVGVIRNAQAEPSGFVLLAADLSERAKLEAQLRHAQKMDAVGQLAGGIAHDFNNLLTVVTGYAGLLLSELPKDEPIRPDIKEIMSAADRAGVLTRQLLAFSRQQMLEPRVLDLNEVVEGMEQMLRRVLPADIKVAMQLDRSLGCVNADPGQLAQVLMNLIVNARDAMPDGGELVIETRDVRLDGVDGSECAGAAPGDYVTLGVSDTGCGIDESIQQRIFEPFFTTKEYGKGSGLGLSTAHGIIAQSGGHIAVVSKPGRGTTFKVYLPRVQSEPLANVASVSSSTVTRGAETILLVEDDHPVRTTATRILERAGYKVYSAADGSEALAIHDRIGSRIDLLLTDMIMPEMSGGELAARIRTREPNVAVLVMSGYTEQTSLRQSLVDSGSVFIQKPFTPEALTAKVREALNTTVMANAS
jgi:two-component system, cell cycle sensor histidine kinase and response regulator CckA